MAGKYRGAIAALVGVALAVSVPIAPAAADDALGAVSVHLTAPAGDDASAGCVEARTDADTVAASTCLGAAGEYVIEGLAPGEYRLRFAGFTGAAADQWNGPAATFADATVVSVVAGATAQVSATLLAPRTLVGTVRDTDGDPVGGGSVEIYTGGKLSLLRSVPVAADGTFAVTGVSEMALRAVPVGTLAKTWYPSKPTSETATRVQVANGAIVTGVDILLEEGGAIEGTIAAPPSVTGTPVCVVLLESSNTDGLPRIAHQCGERGTPFRFAQLPAATYVLCVTQFVATPRCDTGGSFVWRFFGANTSTGTDDAEPIAVSANTTTQVELKWGGTMLVRPTLNGTPVTDGCLEMRDGTTGEVLQRDCEATDGFYEAHYEDDAGFSGSKPVWMTGFAGANATKLKSGSVVDAGKTFTTTRALDKPGRITGAVTLPEGFSDASVCIDVQPSSGDVVTTCLAPGVRTYDIAAADGPAQVHFRTDADMVAGEWYDNTPFMSAAALVDVKTTYSRTINVDLGAGGVVDVTLAADGALSPVSGCVLLIAASGSVAEVQCRTFGSGHAVFTGVTPGDYTLRALDVDGYNDTWLGGAASIGGADTFSVSAGATVEEELELDAFSGARFDILHNDGRADGGCVAIWDAQWSYVESRCQEGGARVSFPDLPGGDYYALFSDFDEDSRPHAADMWWGGTPSVDLAQTFHVSESGGADLAIELPDGGTLAFRLDQSYSDFSYTGTIEVYTDDLDFVVSFDKGSSNEVRIDGLPAGNYYVKFLDFEGFGNQWYWPGAALGPEPGTRAPLTVDPTYYGSIREYISLDLNRTTLVGTFRSPPGWTAPEVCVGVFYVGNAAWPASFECGTPGESFELTHLVTDIDFSVLVVPGPMPSLEAWENLPDQRLWMGSTTTRSKAAVGYLGEELSYYLPLAYFKDVTAKTQGFWDIAWMADAGISTGYGDGTYKPNGKVIRQDMARFLYRLEGSPEVEVPFVSPFKDVKTTDAAYEAIYWLKQEGITTVNPFEPKDNVTRRQMALFMYRMAGEPAVTLPSKSPFKDVKKTDSAYKAMVWMKKAGISTGYSDGTYRPNAHVLRGHMAMFMSRYASQ